MVGRGYELDNGDQVVLTDEELATAAPRKTRTIDIEAFVDLADVDPIYFDHPYFLLPAGEGEGSKRAYQLLLKVMQRTDRAALGRFVMRTKEYLVIVRVRDDLLALTTMLFHDEIRPAKGIPAGGKKPKKAQLDGAIALIEALAVDWDPSQYEDRYRERLLDVVKRKKKGKRITVPDDERQPAPVPDLMAALEESLKAAKGGGTSGGTTATRPRRAQPRRALRACPGRRRLGPVVDVQGRAGRGARRDLGHLGGGRFGRERVRGLAVPQVLEARRKRLRRPSKSGRRAVRTLASHFGCGRELDNRLSEQAQMCICDSPSRRPISAPIMNLS